MIEEYQRVLDFCKIHSLPEPFLRQSEAWLQGLWKAYLRLLEIVPCGLKGKGVVDFGCKYGHLLPLLIAMGASRAIGIDVEDAYLDEGRAVFEKLYPDVKLLKSEQGYIPLQPETVDLVVVNEVISHINPSYLETFYAETGRILKRKGVVLISDGNNVENGPCRERMNSLYGAWENGPDGIKINHDTVVESYLTRRKRIIRRRYPDLAPPRVDYLAENTSALFGDFLLRTIDEYVKTGELIQRPFRHGISPTNPNSSGAVMERGVHPLQISKSLESYGIRCKRVLLRPIFSRSGPKGLLRDALIQVRYRVERVFCPGLQQMRAEGFQLVGVKE